MLTLTTRDGPRDCSGASRREFLRVGALGALTLPGWLSLRELQASSSGNEESFIRDKSIVLLYLSGGASHIETFNPNMDAPAPYRSLTGEVGTTVPGLTFGANFPLLAKHAHRMVIVRSFRHPVGGHEQAHVHVLSGGTDPRGDTRNGHSIGSACSRILGSNAPRTGMPTYTLLTHPEKDGQYRKELGRVRKGSWPGEFGAGYAPFEHDGGGSDEEKGKRRGKNKNRGGGPDGIAKDMRLNIELGRLGKRRALLDGFDRLRRDVETSASVRTAGKYQELAFDLILGKGAEAFDLSGEDPSLVERYDTRATKIGHKIFRPSTLGLQMLTARRLVEAGCRFITVHSAGWDMHADGNNPNVVTGMNMLGPTVDKSVSTFLEDLEDHGLSDDVLLVITGDFGRTPKVNQKGGRDHWANLATLAFAGGGLRTGGVVGRSDRQNAAPDSPPVSPRNMMGTILHTLFDAGAMRIARGVPRELLSLVESSQPIDGLL